MKNEKLLVILLCFGLISCKPSLKVETLSKNPVIKKDSLEHKERRFPKPTGYVNDFDNVFTHEQKISLEKVISEYEIKTTREIAIVTIDSIKPYANIKGFATDLSIEWGVGKKEKDNGLTIIFSKRLRLIRISTGNGTEKILTNEICKEVIDQKIIPEFKLGNYYLGIEQGLFELMLKWEGSE